jgi:hypothetical protein
MIVQFFLYQFSNILSILYLEHCDDTFTIFVVLFFLIIYEKKFSINKNIRELDN